MGDGSEVRNAQDDVVDEAFERVLRPGQRIVVGQAFGTPQALVRGLARHPERLRGSQVLVGMLLDDFPVLEGVDIVTFFPSGPFGSVEGMRSRGARYARESLFALARGFETGRHAVDVLLGQGGEGDDGRYGFGVSVDYMPAAAAAADRIVLETAPQVPWTGEAAVVPGVGVVAVSGSSGPSVLSRAPSVRDERLAEHVVRWIPDGATLQLGMGPWTVAVARRLEARRSLRVHSGLVSDWAQALERAGALSDAHPIVGTGAGGSPEFYRWLDRNPRVELRSAVRTHDPAVLDGLARLHAVNSVLEVDLLGRVNSEIGHDGRRGGVAGLPDFAGGAARHPEGCSIVALASTARERSRIVAQLPPDAVSLPPGMVDIVVTEHGSADLRGRDAAGRARAMLAIADPTHRGDLERAARSAGLFE